MVEINCTRVIEFDAAHRVMNHESKCATLHGHRYRVEITAAANAGLDAIGRVIDFSVLKSKIGSWVDSNWDHTSIIFIEDQKTLDVLKSIPGHKPPFASGWNPTAENIASYLLNVVCPRELSGCGIRVISIVVWETPNCRAEAVL